MDPSTAVSVHWQREHREEMYRLERTRIPGSDATLAGGVRWTTPRWEDRVFFSLLSSPPALKLSSVHRSDTGTYTCHVTYANGTLWIASRVDLFVAVPMGPLIIKDDNGTFLRDIAGPYREGDTPAFTCELAQFDYNVTMTWSCDGDHCGTQPPTIPTPTGGWTSTLQMGTLRRRHLLTNVTCEANSNVSNPVTVSVLLELSLMPLTVTVQSWHPTIIAGLPHEMECTVTGTRPPPRITWWLEDESLEAVYSDVSPDGNVSSSVVIITPTAEAAGKSLECRAENARLPQSPVSGYYIIGIPSKPIVELELGSGLNVSHISEGMDVYMECTVLAVPSESEVVWTHNDRTLAAGTSAGMLVTPRFLVIRSITRKHRGQYVCKVANDEAEVESTPLVLRVNYSPRCQHDAPRQLVVEAQRLVNVTCAVDADPPALSYSWSLNGTGALTGVGSTSTPSLQFKAQNLPATLLCWARNRVGFQREPCQILLLPRPLGPSKDQAVDGLNCSVGSYTEVSFMLSCRTHHNVSHLTVEVYEAGKKRALAQKFNTSSLSGIWTGKLKPATDYLVVVHAPSGLTFRTYVHTLVPAQNLKKQSGGSWFSVSAMFAVACGIVSCLIIGGIGLCCLWTKRTQKPGRQNEVQKGTDSKPNALSKEDGS
ncbi:synaptogenesis protein syg-2-like [Ornithodoros turicata]|uniref:synaptogenesis protein syg-2-like n=1 Tax=Ornithodoros turicata TaxID=34597 RepID=UPI00313A228C